LPRSGVVKFVGREEKLEQLHSQLQRSDYSDYYVITGMGGIGKTELALQYAINQLQKGYYSAGFCWLRARDREIATQIVTFATIHLDLKVPEKLEIYDQLAFCWQHWPQGEVLIVLDDVTDYKMVESYLPPADPRFKLLITTRLDLGFTVQKIIIEELDEDSAIALLESLVGAERVRSQFNDAQSLCQWVGYLPLAMALLGKFLVRKPDWSICRLLKELEEKRLDAKALIETERGMTGQLGMTATLELSWQELNESEQELACLLGLFAIAPIPWSLVESCLPEISSENLEDTRDDGLMDRHMLKRVGEGRYQLHQIVQQYFRIKLEQKIDGGQSNKVIFWQVMVEIAQDINDITTINLIKNLRELIVHLEEGIRWWIDSISDENLICPYVGIGYFYQGQGNYSFAEPWYKDCLEVTKKRLGENHPDIAIILHNLAQLYRSQGRYEEAEPLFHSSLQMSKHLLGEEHPNIATIQNDLATLYESQGKYEEAEQLYYLALEMSKCLLGEDHPEVAKIQNNLATLYKIKGKYEQAEQLYYLALEMSKRLLGENHSEIATIQNNLAEVYCLQGKYEEAECFYLSSLEKRKHLLGEQHPFMATSLNNLAALYCIQGKYKKAERLYLSSLEKRKRLLGENHPLVATIMNNLAELYRSQGKFEEAEPLYCSALKMSKHFLGENHPEVATIMNNLAKLYHSQRKFEEAERLYCSALKMSKRLLGAEHPEVATSQWNLGALYQNQGRYPEAEALYRQALATAQSKLGSNHRHTQGIINALNSLPQP
jgi:tetratricopeptide (TPR) repeat protein